MKSAALKPKILQLDYLGKFLLIVVANDTIMGADASALKILFSVLVVLLYGVANATSLQVRIILSQPQNTIPDESCITEPWSQCSQGSYLSTESGHLF